MSRKINNKEKICLKLNQEQNWRCFYCYIKFDSNDKRKTATLDHLEPYCKVWNKTKFVLACQKCNHLKWNISQELFEDWYICCNFKYSYDWQSENKPVKVRQPIRWFNKLLPNIFPWNNKKYKKEQEKRLIENKESKRSKTQIEKINALWLVYDRDAYIWSQQFHIDKALDILEDIKTLI